MSAAPLPHPSSTLVPGGVLFLALDGFTGPAWEGLPASAVVQARILVEAHLSADTGEPVADMLVTCRTVSGVEFTVATSPTGEVECYVIDDARDAAWIRAAKVSGEATAVLYDRMVELLGLPTREDSNAAT